MFDNAEWSRSHYGSSMNPFHMKSNAIGVAKRLVEMYPDKQFVFCYRGMSGVANATTLVLAMIDVDPSKVLGMIYVRKPEERTNSCHRQEFSFSSDTFSVQDAVLVFVDDFICTSDTLRRTLSEVHRAVDENTYLMFRHTIKNFIKSNRSVLIVQLDNSPNNAISQYKYTIDDSDYYIFLGRACHVRKIS